MASNKKIITLKEKRLLLHSQTTQQHPEFYKFLKETKDDDLTEKLMYELSPKLQNFINHFFPKINKEAKEEWTADEEACEDLDQKRTTCSLCNNPNLRYVFYITNSLTKKKLKVGSTCITYFGVELAKDTQELIENMKRSTRLRKLNESIPGIQKIIDNWITNLNKYKIIIPKEISSPYEKNGKKARKIYNNFLDNQLSKEKTIKKLKPLLEKKEKQIKIIENYVKKHSNNKYIVTKNIWNWAKKHNIKTKALNNLKTKGKITKFTAHRIKEINFMKTVATDLNPYFKKINMTIDVSPQKIGYIINLITEGNIKFFCKHKDLFLDYGYGLVIFNEEPINKLNTKNVIDMVSVDNEETIDYLMNKLSFIIRNENINIYKWDFEQNKIYFKENHDKYIEIKLFDFIEKFKSLALGLNNNIKKLVEKITKESNTRISKTDINTLEYLNKEKNIKTSNF